LLITDIAWNFEIAGIAAREGHVRSTAGALILVADTDVPGAMFRMCADHQPRSDTVLGLPGDARGNAEIALHLLIGEGRFALVHIA